MDNLSPSHDSARSHVTGTSEYVDDRPILPREVFVDVVHSTHAHARVLKIDTRAALALPGVVAAFTAKDFAELYWGSIFHDQPLLASDVVQFCGEPLVILAAESLDTLRAAKTLVEIRYEPLPAILTIHDAIRKKSFIAGERKIERGSSNDDTVPSALDSVIADAPHQLEGTLTLQGADHFYLESQCAIAYPLENNTIEVHSSSQHPTEVQHVIAHALGLADHRVTCVVKRMGGAFGGKESQAAPFAAYAALVAQKLQRPARIAISKDDDMKITGKRNPFFISYRVGFKNDGTLLALDARLFSDGGAYADLSTAIMERALLHSDNAYFVPHLRVRGQVCKTNTHPSTAFRGFGGPKGVTMIEKIIEEIAERLNMDPLDVRQKNVYRPGYDVTHYGQKIENNVLPALFEQLEVACDYRRRRAEISDWNATKAIAQKELRGLSLTAVKFGISFTTRHLNQANALVVVHRDGTVQVSTGATEMGQGVNTRIAQLVAEVFGISHNDVRVLATTTDKNGNTSPTAASSGTDLNGSAAVLAARRIRARLNQVAAHMRRTERDRWATFTAGLGTEKEFELSEDSSDSFMDMFPFREIVTEAYYNRVSLSEYAHYKIPNLGFNKVTGQGRAFLYYTQGAAATEISINTVTGEVKILRTDILMDLGRPINRALDLGQIMGGYIQGLGWMTTENLFYDDHGALVSHSPSTYKIPNIQD
ncbi:MAG TPA: molybdopterin-dependent oxidoreductase, partial [Oligoflexia bacterium]|nr:molybdopterin-dependent oxidoreductase [Oligoflexia bacterium]